MRRGVLGAAVLASLLLGPPGSASAGTLDQQQTASDVFGYVSSSQSLAQTFTAGISGGLDRVDLFLNHTDSPTEGITVEIHDVASGAPGSAVLAANGIPASAIGTTAAFVSVPFASPAPVTAGTQYAIVAYSADPGNSYDWFYANGNVYPGGNQLYTGDSPPTSASPWVPVTGADHAFKTYVAPPAKTGQRAAALKSCKKRARKHNWSKKRLKKCKRKARRLPV
jgi:hypothetical protein